MNYCAKALVLSLIASGQMIGFGFSSMRMPIQKAPNNWAQELTIRIIEIGTGKVYSTATIKDVKGKTKSSSIKLPTSARSTIEEAEKNFKGYAIQIESKAEDEGVGRIFPLDDDLFKAVKTGPKHYRKLNKLHLYINAHTMGTCTDLFESFSFL